MFKVGIVTLSDRCFQGLAVDQSGPLIREQLPALYQVTKQTILPDEENQLVEAFLFKEDARSLLICLVARKV